MLGGLEQGFAANWQVTASLVAVEQGQLVHQHRTSGEALGGSRSSRRDLPQAVEDPFELAVTVRNGMRPQLMKDAPHRHSLIAVGIPPPLAGDQDAAAGKAAVTQRAVLIAGSGHDIA